MKIKHIISAALLVLTPCLSFGETLTFKSEDIFFGYNFVYPNLELQSISDVDVRVEKTLIDNGHEPEFSIKNIEFKFPFANNLKVSGFEKLEGTNDTYRAIVTSPWVFKKVMVEVMALDFSQDQNMVVSVSVVENSSNINSITQVEGARLFGGSLKLVDVSPNKVVDVLHTSYLGKALTLRLYDKTLIDTVQIQAVWMGHGTQILNLIAPTHPNMTPVALLSETIDGDQRIKVSMTDGFGIIDSPDESLHLLLEEKFGPLPFPEPTE